MELHISQRLRDALPSLTDEQWERLRDNITEDGRLTDPIVHWWDGEREVIVDGMTRWGILGELEAEGVEIPYDTERMEFDDIGAAEVWILRRQAGRRNLTPQQLAEIRGRWYNAEKDRDPESRLPSGQIDHQGRDTEKTKEPREKTADRIAAETGVSEATVRRDAKKQETIQAIPENIRGGMKDVLQSATQGLLGRFVGLDSGDQQKIARAVRCGQAASLKDAFGSEGVALTKPKATKPPKPGKEVPGAAKLVDDLTKKHVGLLARGLTAIGKANGGEGEVWQAADDALNALIAALKELRKGKQ